MNCEVCQAKLRIDNTIGVCRTHRHLSKKTLARIAAWKDQNREHLRYYKRKHFSENRQRYAEAQKQRLETNPVAKLAHSVRTRLNSLVKGRRKQAGLVELLGCQPHELVKHLESKFKHGMSWKNHTHKGWHIDHIIPLSSFDLTDVNQLKKACHYTNLQPLWHLENIHKRNRIESSQECPTA